MTLHHGRLFPSVMCHFGEYQSRMTAVSRRIDPSFPFRVEALGRRVSGVGLGCASLDSRIGVRKGLEALERAYEAGIAWYDVAPSYGDAMAESTLGEFASRKRDSVYVCTRLACARRIPPPPCDC